MLLLFALILASCQQPSEFELTNQFDPESPNFRLQPPIGFTASVSTANVFTLSWFPGKFDRAHSQLRYIRGVDTTMILDEVISATSVSYDDVAINATPFHFELRTLVGDTATAWLKTPVFRYELAPITNVSVAGRDDGIDLSWTQAQVAAFSVYTSGAERRIHVPVKHSELYRSVDGGLFELIDTTLTQAYKHEFEPELGVRYRYLIRSFAETLQRESSASTALRLDEQWQSAVLSQSLFRELKSINHETGELLFASFNNNRLEGFNLNTMQHTFSVNLKESFNVPPNHSYGYVTVVNGLGDEVMIGEGYRMHSYNKVTGAKRLVTELDPKYIIQGIYNDPATEKLVIVAVHVKVPVAEEPPEVYDVFVLDLNTDQVVSIYSDIYGYQLSFPEISTWDSKLIFHFHHLQVLEYTSLVDYGVETYAIADNYWRGPTILSSENNETAVVMVHNIAGFSVHQKSHQSTLKHVEFGRILRLHYDRTNQWLYLWYTGKTRIVDIADDYNVIKTYDSQIVRPDGFLWDGRVFQIPAQNPRLTEHMLNRVWLSGN